MSKRIESPKRDITLRSGSVVFDPIAKEYDESRAVPLDLLQKFSEVLKDRTNLQSVSRIFEIGVGTGRIGGRLEEHLNCDTTGIDLSIPMLQIAKEQFPNLNLVHGDAQTIPVRNEVFDLIIVIAVLHLIRGWQSVVSEIFRLLKSKGWFLTGSVGTRSDPIGIRNIYWQHVEEKFRDLPHIGSKDRMEIVTYAEKVGFEQREPEIKIIASMEVPVKYLYNRIRDRCYSSSWRLSDEVHIGAMNKLDEQLLAEKVDLHSSVTVEALADIVLFQKP